MHNLFRLKFIHPFLLLKQFTFAQPVVRLLSGVILLAFASQLSVPFWPVPLTFQSTTVILIGMIFGAREGSTIVLLYLTAGMIGLPVFEGFASGLTKFLGPTGGYLIGFLPAVWLSGYFADKGSTQKIWSTFFIAIVADSLIFTFGIIVLTQFVGTKGAILFGLFPFIFSEFAKLIALALIIPIFLKKAPHQ